MSRPEEKTRRLLWLTQPSVKASGSEARGDLGAYGGYVLHHSLDVIKQLPKTSPDRPFFIAVDLQRWPSELGDAPNFEHLGWSYLADQEPLDLTLEAWQLGQTLRSHDINLLMGISLDPKFWGAESLPADHAQTSQIAKAATTFLDGLNAAGVVTALDDFRITNFEQLQGQGRGFGLALAKGAPLVVVDEQTSSKSCAFLRQELEFTGLIAVRASAQTAGDRLREGCDLLVIDAMDADLIAGTLEATVDDGLVDKIAASQGRLEAVASDWL